MAVVVGRASRLAAVGAAALLALLFAAAEPRAVDESLGVEAAIDHYAVQAAAVTGAPAPRVKPAASRPAPKRIAVVAAGMAAALAGVVILVCTSLGAVPAARHARRPRWRPSGNRGPPALLLA